MARTPGLVVTTSALTHKGVAKGESGRMLVRVSVTLTFKGLDPKSRWEEEVATHVLVEADGTPLPGQFSEADGVAWLRARDEELKQAEFSVKPLFGLKAETFNAELLEGDDSTMLVSGTAQLVVLADVGGKDKKHETGVELSLYAVGPVSKTILVVTPDRAHAYDAYGKLIEKQALTVTPARRRRHP